MLRLRTAAAALLLGSAPVHAACEEATLNAELDAAEAAFLAMDSAAFTAAWERSTATVDCLDAPITPATAARVHGVMALSAFLNRDENTLLAAFHALHRADPEQSFGDWLPERHPILLEWRLATRLEPTAPVPLVKTRGVTVWIDGTAAQERVPDQPAVLQRIEDGAVTSSMLYLPPPEPPPWAAVEAPRMRPELRRRLILGSALTVSLAGTAAFFAVSDAAHDRYVSPATAYSELDGLEQRARRSSVAGIVGASVSAGLGATLVVLW
jgi:hypothetical protein